MTKDPIIVSSTSQQRALFDKFTKESNGFSTEDVVGASANLMVNAIRQANKTQRDAELSFDALFASVKNLLVEHYDSLGRKRGLFPYHQVIEVPHFDARNKI